MLSYVRIQKLLPLIQFPSEVGFFPRRAEGFGLVEKMTSVPVAKNESEVFYHLRRCALCRSERLKSGFELSA